MALLLANSLPPGERPLPLIARCALKKSWWRVFDAALDGIADPPTRELWRGIEEAKRGRYAEALERLDAGGSEGANFARSLRLSLAIREAMAAQALDGGGPRRFGASRDGDGYSSDILRAWSEWRASHPGPHEWSDTPSSIRDSAGGALVYNPARDLFRQYHRATTARPLRLRVAGPVVLRVEARPLHAADSTSPADGWILLREPGWLYPIAINDNVPAHGITTAAAEGCREPRSSTTCRSAPAFTGRSPRRR